ncbi:hypothetical protein [uncultured Kluyvera sp.]|uniref:hypothetical protein n=1 Tax=uncultured Kluyvera sp. TaxID=286549 RepID=UPI0028042FCA|nr:hypothetical protein [uncultured Kluyvera sp.]
MGEQFENKNEKQIQSSSLRALSVSRSEFHQYFLDFENKFGEMACPLCKKTLWGVPPREDSQDHPALITYPLPNSAGRGIWAFPVICMECGYIATFAANHVSGKIKGG